MLLTVENLCVNYGRIEALRDISFEVAEGDIVALVGANGAGKSTTLKTVSGLRSVRAGSVLFDGEDITHLSAHARVAKGISQAPEGRGIFPGMTVRENLEMGAYLRTDRRTPAYRQDQERVLTLFPRLQERISQSAGTLSGGEQQMLAIGRALMTNPDLILIDEATEGLAPLVAQEIWKTLDAVRGEGIGTIVVDKDIGNLSRVADRVLVLSKGAVVFEGTPAALSAEPGLLERHLGV